MSTAKESGMQKKPIKVEDPIESYDDWLYRTSCEAEAEAEKNGWFTTEEVETIMAKHKYEALKKTPKSRY
jgi:hypothetical protein